MNSSLDITKQLGKSEDSNRSHAKGDTKTKKIFK